MTTQAASVPAGIATTFRVDGRVAVVTGAARGIGLAIADQLHALGARVVEADLGFDAQPVEVAEGRLRLRVDVGEPASTAELGARVAEHWGRCDVLVNNAGIGAPATPLEDRSLEVWDRLLRVNLRGALLCAQALLPLMLRQGGGSIVNLASIAARSPAGHGAYSTAKAGLRGLTQQMAVEWGPRGVRANSVSPGMIRTPLSEPHYRDEAKVRTRVERIPARRIGVPSDIAGVVAFLASDASVYVNGQDIVADGGFLTAPLSSLY
jgi:NAD(P)-dependent dehydrogenase (short-subunit alcohol dehydrogenase family)